MLLAKLNIIADKSSIGDIKEIMLAMRSGYVSYAVLKFGAFLGLGSNYLRYLECVDTGYH